MTEPKVFTGFDLLKEKRDHPKTLSDKIRRYRRLIRQRRRNVLRRVYRVFGKDYDVWPLQSRKARKERGRKGFDSSDVWNLDSYLMQVMGTSIRHLAEIDHGYPMEFTAESWYAELNEIADQCELYHRYMDIMDDDVTEFDIEALMVRLAKIWTGLWD